MKRTPLYDHHIADGGKMVEFAGFEMPVSYAGLKEEHHSVRKAVGMFDVSHMGEFIVEGPEALDLIQWITTNDAARLAPGQVQYSCMPNGKGGIVDDLLVYRLEDQKFMLVVNASNMEKDWQWISDQNRFQATLSNVSDNFALIALQGPRAAEILAPLADSPNPSELKYYTFREGNVVGVPTIISATGYTGAGGFELYVPADRAGEIWAALRAASVPPCGLGARDTLRLEAGFCLYGNDIDDTTSPIAAGLGWITKFTKDFVDSETFKAHKENGTESRLMGVRMEGKGIPRSGYECVDGDGHVIGQLTSGTQSPTLEVGIGLAYLNADTAKVGTAIAVRIRNKDIPATVVKPGFLPR